MKILVRLFLIILVMFSCSHGKEELFSEKLMDNMSRSMIKRFYTTPNNRRNTPYLSTEDNNFIEKKVRFLKNYKKSKKSKTFYKTMLEAYSTFIKSHRAYITKWNKTNPNQKNSRFYKNNVLNIQSNTEFLNKATNHIKYLEAQIQKEKEPIGERYKSWAKKKEIPKPATKKLKVSAANMSKSISKVTLKSLNLKTTVKTNNISVSNKAKASVGSVSIGKEEK